VLQSQTLCRSDSTRMLLWINAEVWIDAVQRTWPSKLGTVNKKRSVRRQGRDPTLPLPFTPLVSTGRWQTTGFQLLRVVESGKAVVRFVIGVVPTISVLGELPAGQEWAITAREESGRGAAERG